MQSLLLSGSIVLPMLLKEEIIQQKTCHILQPYDTITVY